MRFVTIMGLTLIAKAIDIKVFNTNASLFAVITILAFIVDGIDCYKRWIK